jgi:outer membrane protein
LVGDWLELCLALFEMKSLLRTIVLLLLWVGLAGAPVWGQSRMATVDLRKVFDNYWRTKQADAALKERAADMEKDHKTMVDNWKKSKEEYSALLTEANNTTLSIEERDKRKKSAEDKFKQIKENEDEIGQYERRARATLDEQKKRIRDSILDEIRTTVNGKAKAGNFALVFDTAAESANGTPVFVYSSSENDLTEAVISQLNAGAPPETPKTEEKKPDTKADTKDGKKKGKK